MDSCFDDLHVPFVMQVFLVLVHVHREALGFLDKVAQVFRHRWSQVLSLQCLAYALARDWLCQRDGVLVTQYGAYAAEGVSFFGEFDDERFDFFGLVFAPAGWTSAYWANAV